MWSNFDPHDKQNFAPQTMSAASGTIMMYGNNKPFAKYNIQGVFLTGTPLKVLNTNKLIWARLGVSRPIYVNVDSPNLGIPNFNF